MTGYGDTEEEAIGNCKRLFNQLIHSYRAKGVLEEVLNRSSIDWQWLDVESVAQAGYEDTNKLVTSKANGGDSTAIIDFPDNPVELPPYDVQTRAWVASPPMGKEMEPVRMAA